MERIVCNDVTDTLIQAMEKSDRMKSVVVIYETTEEYEKAHEGFNYGIFHNNNATVEKLNWMVNVAKNWMFGL